MLRFQAAIKEVTHERRNLTLEWPRGQASRMTHREGFHLPAKLWPQIFLEGTGQEQLTAATFTQEPIKISTPRAA